MANLTLPLNERDLNPGQVERLDRQRHWGLALQVISAQFSIIAILLTVWAGQDLTYSPNWIHPMAYYMTVAAVIALVTGFYGTWLRRGRPEF